MIDTRDTATQYCTNLSSLDVYMATVNSDIKKFNEYVKLNYTDLTDRGEWCDDLVANLFKGYTASAYREFLRYVKTKQDAYDDGEDITSDKLVTLALNKFEILSDSSQWKSKSPEEEQIVAMSSEIRKIKDDNLCLANAIKKKGPPSKKIKTPGKKTKTKKTKTKSKQRSNDKKYALKKVAPKDGGTQTKIVSDLNYWWCPYHNAWTRHYPDFEETESCHHLQ